MPLPRIMVAPNGARMQKADHPALPITQAEIVACARDCFATGAGAIHAHIRDTDGQHLLDAGRYRSLVKAVHDAVPEMAIQITTEAAGCYTADHQMQVALAAGADMVSTSIREICRAGRSAVRSFIYACADQNIRLQYILYNSEDCALLAQVLEEEELYDPSLQLLFVLGKYGREAARPTDLGKFWGWMSRHQIAPDWALCAFGPDEVRCLLAAAQKGGKCRTGFENSVHLLDGSIAPDNAAKVADLYAALDRQDQ